MLRQLLKVEPGEGFKVLQFALLGALLQAGVAIGMSTADALFLVNVGVDKLPYIYMLTPVMMLLYVPVYAYLLGRFGIDRVFDATLGVLALGGVLFFFGFSVAGEGTLVFYLARLYSALWYIALYSLFWNFADSYFDIQDAKRLFALFSGGAALGAVVGGTLVSLLSGVVGVQQLYLVWAGLAVLTLPVAMLVRRRYVRLEEPGGDAAGDVLQQAREAMHSFRSTPFVLLFLAAMMLILFLTTVNEYQYLAIFSSNSSEEDLARLFGVLFAAVNVFNLLVNFFLFNRLVLSIGVRNVALIQPVAYFAAFSLLLFTPGFGAAVFAFFTYHGVLTSIDYNNQNFLFNAVPGEVRKQVRTMIEGLCEPFATALGGLFLLFAASRLSPSAISSVGLLAAALLLTTVLLLRGAYLRSMIVNLRKGWLDLSRPGEKVVEKLPRPELEHVALRVRDRSVNAYTALRILWVNDRELAIRTLLEHVDGGDGEHDAEIRALLSTMLRDQDADVIRQVLFWLNEALPRLDTGLIEELGHHKFIQPREVPGLYAAAEPASNAAAITISWNSWRPEDRLEALQRLEALLRGPDAAVEAGVRAVGRMRTPELAHAVLPHLEHESARVRRAAVTAIRRIADRGSARLIEPVLAAIARGGEEERVDGLLALTRIDDPRCIPALLRMADELTPYERREALRVLERMGLKSVPATLMVLRDPTMPYRGRALAVRTLGKLSLPQLESVSPALIESEIDRAYRFRSAAAGIRHADRPGVGLSVLERFYRDTQAVIVDFILEILSVGGRLPDFELISSSLRSTNPKERGNALETVEEGVPRPVFRKLRGLLDERHALVVRPQSIDAVLDAAFDSPFALESAAAAQAIWEIGGDDAAERLRTQVHRNQHALFRDTVLALFAGGGAGEPVNHIERLHLLANTRFFGALRLHDLTSFARNAQLQSYDDGDIMVAAGELGDFVCVLVSGSAHGDGLQLRAGDLIGVDALARRAHAVTVRAQGCRALLIDRADVMRGAYANSAIAIELLRLQEERVHAA